jgi:tRNA A-37 threonylcarbamoyl transferase component Bud32
VGIAEKRPDSLRTIQGVDADRFRAIVEQLLQGQLPDGWQWVACSKNAVVAAAADAKYYYKEYLPRNQLEGVKRLVRGGRCARARKQAAVLQDLGFYTPAIVCWGRGRKNSFMITKGVGGSGFASYLRDEFHRPLHGHKLRLKRQAIREVGELVGRLHRCGIVHGDLRLGNLLMRETTAGFVYYLIDNERNKRWFRIPRKLVLKNLVQMAMLGLDIFSHADRMRCYRAYASVYPRFIGKEERRLLRDVEKVRQIRVRKTLEKRRERIR